LENLFNRKIGARCGWRLALNEDMSNPSNVENPLQLVAVQEPSANEHWPDERFFGERLGWVTRKYGPSQLYFQISKIIDNVMVY